MVGRVWGEEQMVRGGGCRQDRMESLQFAGFSLHGASLIVERGLQRAGSVVVAHGLGCPVAGGIFLDSGLNLCPLRW